MKILLFILTSMGVSLAQETATPPTNTDKKGTRKVRILAVGDTPISRMIMTQKSVKAMIGHEAEIDKKLLPPKLLFIHKDQKKKENSNNEKDKESTSKEKIRLSLGMMSPTIDVKTKGSSLKLSASETLAVEAKPYSTIQLPAESRENLIILYKHIKSKTWNEPRTIVLSNDKVNFPPQTVRIVNASSLTVGVMIENKSVTLKSGQVKKVTLPKGKNIRIKGFAKLKDKTLKIGNSAIKLDNNQRLDFVFHNRISDSRKPIRIAKFPQTVAP